jgi:uncharacterized C2H2 Zn-finger protein
MPDRPDFFRCPNCKGVSFSQVTVKRKDGSVYLTSFFACNVCTAMFLDPVAYTRGFEDRPRTTNREPTNSSPYQMWSRINQRRRERD